MILYLELLLILGMPDQQMNRGNLFEFVIVKGRDTFRFFTYW